MIKRFKAEVGEDAWVVATGGWAVLWPADGMHTQNDLAYTTVAAYLLQGRVVIANVMHGRHFVLVTGFAAPTAAGAGDALFVNDSGFNRTQYSYSSDVVGWRIFDMANATATAHARP